MRKTLLVTSAGRRNQLIQCFRDDARRIGIDLRVLAADLNPAYSPACQQADAFFAVPRCTAPDYIEALLRICSRERVDLLVPTIDPELHVLSLNRQRFSDANTLALVSSPTVVRLAGNKLQTSCVLRDGKVFTPKTLSLVDYLADPSSLSGAIIAKPNGGSSSIGVIRVKNLAELRGLDASGYIVQEELKGIEYTVNMYFDNAGQLRAAVPHARLEVRSGEVSKGRTERLSCLCDAAKTLATLLVGARGPLCFQAFYSQESGRAGVFEINARFGGGFPLAHAAGATFSRWILEELCGLPSTAADAWRENVTMLRYDSAVFLGGS